MYFTVGGDGTAEVTVKHSKFIAFCSAVASDDEAESFVRGVKKRYTDATHAPYAYLLGEKSDKSRASDDGEPSGTSGIPILEAIKNSGLTNTVVVVVRYFGGIKLGTGGLARAYADAALAALDAAGKKAYDKCAIFALSCDYGLISAVQNQIYAFGACALNCSRSSSNGGNSDGTDFRHREICGSRWAWHPYGGIPEGLSVALPLVPQP